MRLRIVMSETGTQIRNDFIYTVFVVSAKQGIQVEHYITVEIHVIKALLVRTIRTLSTLYIISKGVHGKAFCLKAAILQT